MNQKKYNLDIEGKQISLEFSNWAEQANSSIIARIGETVVLTSAVMSEKDSQSNYFPLNVEYRENYYASGIIGGGSYNKREGRPSSEAILKARLIDRALRPLFNQKIRRDIQVVNTVLSYDNENSPEIISLIASATALYISDIPFRGPLGAVRVAEKQGIYIINPTKTELEEAEFIVLAAGVKGKINMLEVEGDETPEDRVLKAIEVAAKHINEIASFQDKIQQEIGKQKTEVSLYEATSEVKKEIKDLVYTKLQTAVFVENKVEQHENIKKIEHEAEEMLAQKYGSDSENITLGIEYIDELVNEIVHLAALNENKRVDGRRFEQIRTLNGEVGVLPRTHGSGMFMRGLTHILSSVTLGILGNEEMHDDMEGKSEKRFMHHYNFPPYSVGETGMFRGAGRREIGHGALAEKALRPLIPKEEEFPYVVRLVSEVLSSNGSSSMGSVCGSSLALHDAGVPIKKHVAGIAMGLITNPDQSKFKVLTDIQGPEDHHGDMDLKVAGTHEGVTAMQMDVKLDGISMEILKQAVMQAKKAREEILSVLETTIALPRESLSKYVQIVEMIDVDPDKIGQIIGSGGSTIKEIQANTETEITIKEEGKVIVGGLDKAKVEEATNKIKQLGYEVKEGQYFVGKVTKIADFGAFFEIMASTEVLVHISELQNGFVKDVSKILKVGDKKTIKISKIDDQGKIGASLKDIPDKVEAINFID